MKVAIGQIKSNPGDIDKNVEKIIEKIREAK